MSHSTVSDWKDIAACARPGVDADWFHASEREPGAIEQARSVCNLCTVKTNCLLAAYAEGDEWGLRAGLTPRQRNAHLRKAEGNIGRAVANALETTSVLLRQIYRHHAKPQPDGHVLWTDTRHWINVRGTPYTVHRLAWIAHYGRESTGYVRRTCEVENCVAKACLTDQKRPTRSKAKAKTT